MTKKLFSVFAVALILAAQLPKPGGSTGGGGGTPSDATLTALAELDAAVGYLVQTGADTFAKRALTGTNEEISVIGGTGEGGNTSFSLPSVINLGSKTSFELPNSANPTVDAFGEIAGDDNTWGTGRGSPVFFDGTAEIALIGALKSDVPTNGQCPKWNTGGTITWEDCDGGPPIAGAYVSVSGDTVNNAAPMPIVAAGGATANVYAGSPTGCSAVLSGNKIIMLVPDVANTGAATLAYYGGAALAIKLADGTTDPASGDLAAGRHYSLRWVDAATDYWRMEPVGGGAAAVTKTYGASFYNSGSVLTTATSIPFSIPTACTVSAWTISVDAGTATVKVWKVATGTAIPTVSDVINTSGVAISTGTHVRSTTLSDFTDTTWSAGDVFRVALTAVATATMLNFGVECQE